MKKTTKLFVFLFLIFSFFTFGQSDGVFPNPPIQKDSLINTYSRYIYDTKIDVNPKSKLAGFIDKIQSKYSVETNGLIKSNLEDDLYDLKHLVFNPNMLNVFFKNEINSFATSIKDLSLEKYFANVNSDDKTLIIGRTLDLRYFYKNPELLPIRNIITIYGKSSVDKGFSKIYSENKSTNEYNFSADLGLGFKYTRFGNGIIFFDKDRKIHKEKIRAIRNRIIKPSVDDEISKYVKGQFNIDTLEISIKENGKNIPSDIEKEVIEKKYYEFYKKIADKEIEYLKKEKLYYSYVNFWGGFEIYYPLTYKAINLKADNQNGDFEVKEFKDFKYEVFGNLFWNFSKGWSFNTKITGKLVNNNNFISNESKPVTFQTILNQNPSQQILGKSDLVFIGSYDEFLTKSLKGDFTALFFNNSFGISATLEKNYGTYKATNWKLGIPFSLKDKDSKPTVNFEVQWKEINYNHIIGVSVGYAFGKSLK